MTQEDLVSPAIFNIVMDVCKLQEAHQGLVWAEVEKNIVFYVEN